MNLGDITAADFIDKARAFGHLNLLVAGTPCQAFSVAGNRRSLEDARGNLTLRFVEVVDAIEPDAIFWENVPGVLSTKDNAFGCFLAALVGADDAIVPECGWTNAGMVSGPRRNAAWRVFDAQYFGLAQRRKRVFVVACPRNGADPREILFECEGVPRHSAPSREAGETVAGTLDARPSGGGGPAGGTDGACGGYLQPVSHCLNAGGMGRIDCETETLVAHTLGTQCSAVTEDGTGRGSPLVSMAHGIDGVSGTLRSNPGSGFRSNGSNVEAVVSHGSFGVRRLTPRECERLQGCPDDYTALDKAADGPRYKALGNSMAVPVVRWIGLRIVKALKAQNMERAA